MTHMPRVPSRGSKVHPIPQQQANDDDEVMIYTRSDGTKWFVPSRRSQSAETSYNTDEFSIPVEGTQPLAHTLSKIRSTRRCICYTRLYGRWKGHSMEEWYSQHLQQERSHWVLMILRLQYPLVAETITKGWLMFKEAPVSFSSFGLAVLLLGVASAVSSVVSMILEQRRRRLSLHTTKPINVQVDRVNNLFSWAEAIERLFLGCYFTCWYYQAADATLLPLPMPFLTATYLLTLWIMIPMLFQYRRLFLTFLLIPVEFTVAFLATYPELCKWWRIAPLVPNESASPGLACACTTMATPSDSDTVGCYILSVLTVFFVAFANVVHVILFHRNQKHNFLQLFMLKREMELKSLLMARESQAVSTRKQFMAFIFHELRVPFQTISLGFDELRNLLEDKHGTVCFNPAEYNTTVKEMDNAVSSVRAVLDRVLDLGNLEENQLAMNFTRITKYRLAHRIMSRCRAVANSRFSTSMDLECSDDLVLADCHRLSEAIATIIKEFARMVDSPLHMVFADGAQAADITNTVSGPHTETPNTNVPPTEAAYRESRDEITEADLMAWDAPTPPPTTHPTSPYDSSLCVTLTLDVLPDAVHEALSDACRLIKTMLLTASANTSLSLRLGVALVQAHGGLIHAFKDGPSGGVTIRLSLKLVGTDPLNSNSSTDEGESLHFHNTFSVSHSVSGPSVPALEHAVNGSRLGPPSVAYDSKPEGVERGQVPRIVEFPATGRSQEILVQEEASMMTDTPGTTPSPLSIAGSQKRRRALVVDDAPGNRIMVSRLLQRLGFDTVLAADGLDACLMLGVEIPSSIVSSLGLSLEDIERQKVALNTTDPAAIDMIFLDFEMPMLNGGMTCKLLRNAGWITPIVGITGISSPSDRQVFIDAGIDKLLSKPITKRQLQVVANLKKNNLPSQ